MSSDLSPIEKPARGPKARTRLFLYTRAGGRCEFEGCNQYLLEHGPTETPGNFAEQAHIYGFKEKAARAGAPGRPASEEISQVENMILLCPTCHHLVDEVSPQDYTVQALRRFKHEHETRVFDLTATAKDRDTVPILLKGRIAGRPVDVSDEEMQSAAAPNYIKRRERVTIELTSIPDEPDQAFWKTAARAIDARIEGVQAGRSDPGKALRVSVFGLGPIPLLVHLGARLSDKMDVDLYQLHRNPKSWQWKPGVGKAHYATTRLVEGESGGDAALLVNLSGINALESVRAAGVAESVPVYELTLSGQDAGLTFLNTRGDFERFVAEYLLTLARVRKAHPPEAKLHLFPAVPAPVAIAIGLHRLPKVDPTFVVYDRDKRAGGFTKTLEIS
jgi:hypothetical protein